MALFSHSSKMDGKGAIVIYRHPSTSVMRSLNTTTTTINTTTISLALSPRLPPPPPPYTFRIDDADTLFKSSSSSSTVLFIFNDGYKKEKKRDILATARFWEHTNTHTHLEGRGFAGRVLLITPKVVIRRHQ